MIKVEISIILTIMIFTILGIIKSINSISKEKKTISRYKLQYKMRWLKICVLKPVKDLREINLQNFPIFTPLKMICNIASLEKAFVGHYNTCI